MTDDPLRSHLIVLARRERRSSVILGPVLLVVGILLLVAAVASPHQRRRVTCATLGLAGVGMSLFQLQRSLTRLRSADRSPAMQALLDAPALVTHIDEIRRQETSLVRVFSGDHGTEFTVDVAEVPQLVVALAERCPNAEVETSVLMRSHPSTPLASPQDSGDGVKGWPFA